MKLFRKVVSTVVAISFLMTNIVFAEANTFKLAVPTKISDTEFKEKAQLQLAIRAALQQAAQDSGLDLDHLTKESLTKLGKVSSEEDSIDPDRMLVRVLFDTTADAAIPGILSNGMAPAEGCLIIQATVNGHIYYCLISKSRENGKFRMSVISHELMAGSVKAGTLVFEHNIVGAEERAIIEKYIAHEISSGSAQAIDPWIAGKMKAGNYMVDINVVPSNMKGFYQNNGWFFSQGSFVEAAMERLVRFGGGLEHEAAIRSKLTETPLVIISYDNDSDLPVLNMDGKDVKVIGHSSQFATYVFVPKDVYDNATRQNTSHLTRDFFDLVLKAYIHEIGARSGFDVRIDGGMARNILDDCLEGYLSSPETFEAPATAREMIHNMRPVNLLSLELRNDYAAGMTKESGKFGIFKRLMYAALIMVGVAGVGTLAYKHFNAKPAAAPVFSGPVTSDKVDAWIRTLKDPNEDVLKRVQSAHALERYVLATRGKTDERPRDAEVINVFIEMLKNENDMVRSASARALGYAQVNRQIVIEALIKSLTDRGIVKLDVAKSLAMLGEKKGKDVLIQSLSSKNFNIRWVSVVYLGEIRAEDAVSPLMEILEYEWSTEIRASIAEALGNIGDERALAALQSAEKKEQDPLTAIKIRIAIGQILKDRAKIDAGFQAYLGHMKQVLGSGRPADMTFISLSEYIRRQGLKDSMSFYKVFTPWLRLVRDTYNDQDIRQRADSCVRLIEWEVNGLAVLMRISMNAERSLLDGFLETMNNGNAAKRQMAIEGFDVENWKTALQDVAYAESILEDNDIKASNPEFFGEFQTCHDRLVISQKAVMALLREVAEKDEDAPVREAAQKILEKINKPSETKPARAESKEPEQSDPQPEAPVTDQVPGDLKSTDYKVRLDATVALGYSEKDHAEVINTLIGLLKDDTAVSVRAAAAQALGTLWMRGVVEARNAIPNLIDALNDKESRVREESVKALMLIGTDRKDLVVEQLIALLGDRTKGNELEAAMALGVLGDPKAVPALIATLDHSHPATRLYVVNALGKIGQEAKDALPKLEAIAKEDKDEGVRQAAERAINKIKGLTPGSEKTSQETEAGLDLLADVNSTAEELAHLMVQRMFYGESAETGDADQDKQLNSMAMVLLGALGIPAFPKPDDIDIKKIASRINDMENEILLPNTLFPGDKLDDFKKGVGRIFGDKIRIYDANMIEHDLPGMIRNPKRTIVMTMGLKAATASALAAELGQAQDKDMRDVRFMNFDMVDVDKLINEEAYESFMTETLGILLVARVITPKEARDETSVAYRMLACLLEGHIDKDEMLKYIGTITDDVMSVGQKLNMLVNLILKGLPIEAYDIGSQRMKALQVMWAA